MQLTRLIPEPLRAPLRQYRLRYQRWAFARSYYLPKFALIERWLITSREMENFTYDLTEDSRQYLAAFVAAVAKISYEQVRSYIAELDNDGALREHIARETARQAPSNADPLQHYGRRLGWYAFARALKPALIVETGVDKGLGSCVFASAILRNRVEGYEGMYLGTDIRPEAGYLFTGPYAQAGQILYGDSITSLQALAGSPIDIFVNDSDHSADYEAREYQTIAPLLTLRSLVLADNAHHTACLSNFAVQTGRDFLFWREVPQDHWYPGAGIGAAFCRHAINE